MAFTAPLTSALTDALTKPVNDDYYVGDGVVGFISDLGLEMVFEQEAETQISELGFEIVFEEV